MTDERCQECGASFALVGHRHRCVPNTVPNTVPNVPNGLPTHIDVPTLDVRDFVLKTGDAQRVAKWKAANKEKDRAYRRELMRKRRAAAK